MLTNHFTVFPWTLPVCHSFRPSLSAGIPQRSQKKPLNFLPTVTFASLPSRLSILATSSTESEALISIVLATILLTSLRSWAAASRVRSWAPTFWPAWENYQALSSQIYTTPWESLISLPTSFLVTICSFSSRKICLDWNSLISSLKSAYSTLPWPQTYAHTTSYVLDSVSFPSTYV